MKRLFLVVFIGFCVTSMLAQKIVIDRIEDKGRRQVMTETKKFSVDGTDYYFGLKVFEYAYSKDWVMIVCAYSYIPNTAEMLIKLCNDEIIYLPVNNVDVKTMTLPGYGYTVGSVTAISPSKDVDYYISVYELSEDYIKKIQTFGISKIRIFNGIKYSDKVISRNSLGKFITKSYENIMKRLEKSSDKPTGLYDGF